MINHTDFSTLMRILGDLVLSPELQDVLRFVCENMKYIDKYSDKHTVSYFSDRKIYNYVNLKLGLSIPFLDKIQSFKNENPMICRHINSGQISPMRVSDEEFSDSVEFLLKDKMTEITEINAFQEFLFCNVSDCEQVLSLCLSPPNIDEIGQCDKQPGLTWISTIYSKYLTIIDYLNCIHNEWSFSNELPYGISVIMKGSSRCVISIDTFGYKEYSKSSFELFQKLMRYIEHSNIAPLLHQRIDYPSFRDYPDYEDFLKKVRELKADRRRNGDVLVVVDGVRLSHLDSMMLFKFLISLMKHAISG